MSKYDGMTDEQVIEFKAQRMRERRDARLRASDRYLLPDFPITDGQREEVKAYRKALRELPGQEGFPDVELPERPGFMK